MPVLHENPDKADDANEFYVVTEIDGGIVTLETPELIGYLYNKLDYYAGDDLPSRLVWKLFELDYHEIDESDIPVSEVEEYAQTQISRDLSDIEISDERVREIHDFMLDEFPEHGGVMKLGEAYGLELLDEYTHDSSDDPEGRFEPEIENEVVAKAVDEWELTECEKRKIAESGDIRHRESDLHRSIRDMFNHPREVLDLELGLYQTYKLNSKDLPVESFLLHDYRYSDTESMHGVSEIPGNPTGVDFQLEVEINDLTHWFTIREGWIIRQSTVRDEVQDDSEGEFDNMSVQSDRFRHKLLIQRSELLDIVGDFFQELQYYAVSRSGLEEELAHYRAEVTSAGAPSFEEMTELEDLLWIKIEDGISLVRTSVRNAEENRYSIRQIQFTDSDVFYPQTGVISEYADPELSAGIQERDQELRVNGYVPEVMDGSWRNTIPVPENIISRLKELDSVEKISR